MGSAYVDLINQGVFMSIRNMKFGFVHLHANQYDNTVIHKGLDIIIDPNSAWKGQMACELGDYNLINGNSSVSGSDFPRSKIEALYDNIIVKYFESKKKEVAVAEAPQTSTEPPKQIEQAINGQVIKSLIKNGDKYQVRVYQDEPSQELIDAVNKLITLKSVVALQLQEQILICANKLRVGTLDMLPGSTRLKVHVEGDLVDAPNTIPRKQVIASLWFVTSQYLNAPSFRKNLNVTIKNGRYEAGYDKGVAYFKASDGNSLTDLELGVANDLKLIAEMKN